VAGKTDRSLTRAIPECFRDEYQCRMHYEKGKAIPYSIPSIGPGADPGVQAVSPQVTDRKSSTRQ